MPTLPVWPDDSESLQFIADALVKARKVVVVTGAGISTNSGIPDFRSENGLYQLIQEQYEAAARAPAPQPKPGNASLAREPIGEEFPEDRPKKRQRLSQADNEEPSILPEITVRDSGCAGKQGAADGGAEAEMGEEIICAIGAVPDVSVPRDSRDGALPQSRPKESACQSRASSLPPVQRRSMRLNPQAWDTMDLEAAHSETSLQHCPAQPAKSKVPSTPTKARRRTIPSILPGSSSPLSDVPTQVSSPSRIFDGPSFLRTSSPLSDPPSHLGISSPFFERPTFRPAAFPSSSSLLSDPPSHLASSPFLSHLAPLRSSSPLSDPASYLPSSPPLVNRRAHLLSLKSSSPLSSPPPFVLDPFEELPSRENSPSPETREPSKSQESNTSSSSSTSQNGSLEVEESSQSNSCGCSQRPSQPSRKQDCEIEEAEEIYCAANPPPTRPEPSSEQPFTETTHFREAGKASSSNPVSSQGSTSSRLPIPNIKGRDLFDATIWACPIRTSVFYTFATTLRQKVRDVTPTSSHLFISHLRDRGKLVRCYTQNIDRIEEKVGLSTALDRGPGHRSRFSRRAPALSRGQSGASDAPAPAPGFSSSAPEEGKLNSSRAADVRDPPHGREEATHGGRDGDGAGSLPEGRPNSDVCRGSNGTAANGGRGGAQTAPSGDSNNSSGPAISRGNRGETGQRSTAVEGTHRGSAHPVDDTPTSKRVGPSAANDASVGEATGAPGITEQSQEPRQPAFEGVGGPAASQEGSEGSEAGPAAAKPKARQRQPSPSSGVECVFLHGSLESLRCFRCRRVCEWEGLEEQTFVGQQPECPHCAGATAAREERGKRALGVGKLRPDIVLYGEEHPNAHLISPVVTHDLGLGPDLLLILGTSLKVHGLKVLVRQFAKAVHSRGGKVVFVNFTKPPESSWGDIIDYWVAWDCDAWVGDLKEKVPALWLPPGEEPKKRKSVSAKGGEKKTVDKKAAPKKTKVASTKKGGPKKDVKTGEEIVVSSQESTTIEVTTEGATADVGVCTTQEAEASIITAIDPPAELPGHRQSQTNPRSEPQEGQPKQRRVVLREDKVNGAYFTWKIMESLRNIAGRAAPAPMTLPSVEASRAITMAEATQAKRERKRRSTLAAQEAQKQAVSPPQPQMPEVWSIHSSAPAVPPGGTATTTTPMALPPARHTAGKDAPASKTKRKSPAFDLRPPLSTPKTTHQGLPSGTSIPARFDSRKRKLASFQPRTAADPLPSYHPLSPTQPSILAAVKSNPRKRKRKTIDGEEVVLPSVSTRRLSPSADKENVEARRKIPALSAQPMDGTPIRLPPLRGGAGGRWKPVPMEPVSSPEGPVARVEWGRGRGRGIGDPFFYEDVLGGLGREVRWA